MQDFRAAAKSKRKKLGAKGKGSEVHQKVKRVRPRWAYISCRRAGLSHTRIPGGLPRPHHGPSVAGAG